MTDPVASSLACRAVAAASLAYVGCGTVAGTGVGGAGTVEGRAKSPVAAVVSVACRAAAAACSACVAYGTAAGAGAGRAGTAGGKRKDPVAAAACAYRRA